MVLKSKKIEAVRPDVPTVQLENQNEVELADKRVNLLVTESMRLNWKRHVIDFRHKSVAQFIIDAVQEKIEREKSQSR